MSARKRTRRWKLIRSRKVLSQHQVSRESVRCLSTIFIKTPNFSSEIPTCPLMIMMTRKKPMSQLRQPREAKLTMIRRSSKSLRKKMVTYKFIMQRMWSIQMYTKPRLVIKTLVKRYKRKRRRNDSDLVRKRTSVRLS